MARWRSQWVSHNLPTRPCNGSWLAWLTQPVSLLTCGCPVKRVVLVSEYDPTGTSASTHGHDIVQSQSTVMLASAVVDIPQAAAVTDYIVTCVHLFTDWSVTDVTQLMSARRELVWTTHQSGNDFKRIQCHPHHTDQLSRTEGDSSNSRATTKHRTNHLPPVDQTTSRRLLFTPHSVLSLVPQSREHYNTFL